MNPCSIIIVSFGELWWRQLALGRALPSAEAQGDHEIIVLHDPDSNGSPSKLRNRAADMATGEFLVFVDADDEIEPGYVDAMLAATGDIRRPRIRVLCEGPDESPMPEPFEIEPRPLLDGNYIPIGAMIRRELFLKLGGFGEWPFCEDWDFYLKAWIEGASFGFAPEAIYRQNWRQGSRNQPEYQHGEQIREQIRSLYLPRARAKGLIP